MGAYDTGPYGYTLNVNNNALLTTVRPSGIVSKFKDGPYGRSTYVDERGYLVVSIDGLGSSFIEDDFSDLLNGSLYEFLFSNVPKLETIMIYRNGVLCKTGTSNDYVISSSGTLITNFVPRSGGSLTATYYKE